VLPALALLAVTAIWGVTFVQVKDAVALYPLLAFLAVRFAIATATLAPFALRRLGLLGLRGAASGGLLGVLLAGGYALQTEGLARTTVSSTGFITGLYVVLTPLVALLAFRERIAPRAWAGVVLAVCGLGLLSGIHRGRLLGDGLVLASALVQACQIVSVSRFAPRYDPLALTFVELVVSFAGFALVAGALGDVATPRGWTVWGALLVTGVFASAFAYLVQSWVQQRTTATRAALIFTLEAPFAGLFGYLLAGDRLTAAAWAGCAVILAGILLAEPGGAGQAALQGLFRRRPASPAGGTTRAARDFEEGARGGNPVSPTRKNEG
jgi:drug/metabolite transporter (DMT)-like permease